MLGGCLRNPQLGVLFLWCQDQGFTGVLCKWQIEIDPIPAEGDSALKWNYDKHIKKRKGKREPLWTLSAPVLTKCCTDVSTV